MSELPGKSVYREGVAEGSDKGKITLQETFLDAYKNFKINNFWGTHQSNEGVVQVQYIN